MFTRQEIKRNLLGALEVALFMPVARKRFGNTYDEAVRSFIIPILLFPITLGLVYFHPAPAIEHASQNSIALMYSLRMAATWFLFFGSVFWIVNEIDRKEHFYQFIIASNWLSVPATVAMVPVIWALFTGSHTMNELYPFMLCVMFYSYAFTAFMAAHVLRIPLELGGFVVFVSMAINDSTLNILHWVGRVFS